MIPRNPHESHPIEALLFDVDATLSDTEMFWHEAQRRIIAEHGTRTPSPNTPARQPGSSMDEDVSAGVR